MATRKTAKSAAVETEAVEVEETVAEPTFKQLATVAINEAAEALGVESKDRYKVQRAFGYIAMEAAIEGETFSTLDELRDAVIERAGDLPAGFGLERAVAAEKPAPKATKTAAKSAKAPAKKAATKTAAPKAAARKRPQR